MAMNWDFKLGDEILYFDPYKSYELTGYRPINDTDGLDFDPDWFREDAINKIKNKKYSTTVYGSPSYRTFWKDRFDRCTNGGVRINSNIYIPTYEIYSSNNNENDAYESKKWQIRKRYYYTESVW